MFIVAENTGSVNINFCTFQMSITLIIEHVYLLLKN